MVKKLSNRRDKCSTSNAGKSTGRSRKLNWEIEESLKQELQDEPGFSSYREIQTWLQVVHDIEMSYTGVHQLVRYKLKAKLNYDN